MREVLQVLDDAGGRVARGELKRLVGVRTEGELTDELLDHLETSGLVEYPNGLVALTDAGAARLEAPPPAPAPPAPEPREEAPEPQPDPQESEAPPPGRTLAAHDDAEERAQALKEQGFSYRAIAQELGIPRADVGKLLSAAARRKPRRARTPTRAPRPRSSEAAPQSPPPPTRTLAPTRSAAPTELIERLRARREQLLRDIALLDEVLAELEAGGA